jgi:hypothetical protein
VYFRGLNLIILAYWSINIPKYLRGPQHEGSLKSLKHLHPRRYEIYHAPFNMIIISNFVFCDYFWWPVGYYLDIIVRRGNVLLHITILCPKILYSELVGSLIINHRSVAMCSYPYGRVAKDLWTSIRITNIRINNYQFSCPSRW